MAAGAAAGPGRLDFTAAAVDPGYTAIMAHRGSSLASFGPGTALLAAVLVLVAAAVGLLARPLTPVDETRYAAVAWEMYAHGEHLVPMLNGAAYAHKPPLLFWLTVGGWQLLGPSELWLRLLPALFGLVALALVRRLARELWPEREEVAAVAPLLLVASLLFVALTTFIGFDLLLTDFVLVGALGLARAWRRGGIIGWLLVALGVGGGLLSKGPVALLHLVPLALLAPWWSSGRSDRLRVSGGAWFSGLAVALGGGVALALAWAIPAALAGGVAYRDAIFIGQTTGRLVESFQHARPFWWYLPLLPALLFPLALWPTGWRALGAALEAPLGAPARFCLAWMTPPFLAFCLISGKQPHYLLPLVPALVLLVAHGLVEGRAMREGRSLLLPAVGLALVAAALLVAASRTELGGVAIARPGLLVGSGAAALVAAVAIGLGRWRGQSALVGLVAIGLLTYVAAHAVFPAGLGAAYDTKPLAAVLARAEAAGQPLAMVGDYHGQYQFTGRLTTPLAVLEPAAVEAWSAEHPSGVVVDVYRGAARLGPATPLFVGSFKGRSAGVWPAAGLRWLAPLP